MAKPVIAPPAPSLRIDDLETVRLISDATRMAILQAFAASDTPLTVKRLGEILAIPATKLYYHVGLLEDRGLIRVVGTRLVSGIVEKSYQPAATSFEIDRSVFGPTGGAADEIFERIAGTVFDGVRQEVADGVRTGSIVVGESGDRARRMNLSKTITRLSPERADELRSRIAALIAEFDAHDADPDAMDLAMFSVVYPLPPKTGPRRRATPPAPRPGRTS
jgi:Helix-turn-helix domain